MIDLTFYRGKKILITGHTGFKGSWLSTILLKFGAEITGYALNPPTSPCLFNLLKLDNKINSIIGDIREFDSLLSVFKEVNPEIVIHLAAQPIVRESYKSPILTYETNVMGTVNVLECIRQTSSVKSFLNVTTDKVYQNKEWVWGYRETDQLDGFDPYSNSKSCSELVTHCYQNSFFSERNIGVSTARAGNVIGGGDFAVDRIIPDCIRAAQKNEIIFVRNPNSTRPYQHVLEPLFAYLLIVEKQYKHPENSGSYNVGPEDFDCVSTEDLVTLFCQKWGKGLSWKLLSSKGPHEATFLKLDCSKLKGKFNWCSRWDISQAIEKTCEWTIAWMEQKDIASIMNQQIDEYLNGRK